LAKDIPHPDEIPMEKLRKMTTGEVVEQVLANQLVGHILAYDSIQQGIDDIANNNHLLMEMLRRPAEAGHVLLTYYRGMDTAKVKPDLAPAEAEAYNNRLAFAEVLLSHDDILAALPEVERRAILEVALHQYAANHFRRGAISRSGLLFTVLLMGRTLRHQHYPPILQAIEDDDTMEDFLRHGDAAAPWVEQKIVELARNYLKESAGKP
jgi:hypothetical protein